MSRYHRVLTPVRLAVGAAVATATILAGCAKEPETICPAVAVLGSAASVTKFDAGGSGQIAYRAEIMNADLDCAYKTDLLDEMEVNMRIAVVGQKGPAAPSDEAELPYFVVVTDRSGNVITKKVLPLELDFDGNPQVALTEEVWQFYRLKNAGGGGALYEIWVGFQLSDEELEYNRQQSGQAGAAAPSG